MVSNRLRIRVRRAVQGVCLAIFLALLLIFADASQAHSQLAWNTRFGWSPAFLVCLIDPLAAMAAFAAARVLPVMAALPAAIIAFCLVMPRAFCSHVCPMGSMIDLFGALRGKRSERPLPLKPAKYVLLAAVVAGAVAAVPLAGLVTPMPILARGLLAAGPSTAAVAERALWPGVLLIVLLLSLVRRRFWCNYLCPSGALLSIVSRLARRRPVRSEACVSCGKCVEACSFAAIDLVSYNSNGDCAYCAACAEACPVGAITFGSAKPVPVNAGRREFLAGACVAGGLLAIGAVAAGGATPVRHRPPGSMPEDDFTARCVRCGVCALNCPGPAISLMGIGGGLAAWGTPQVVPEVAGCSPTCNNCGRVCPTGAISHLPLVEKNRVSMGTARYLTDICLPHREEDNCTLCHDVCASAGHSAIALAERIVYLDDSAGFMLDDHITMMVPSIRADRCVGCGLCVMTCRRENVLRRKVLPRAAIEVVPKSPQTRLAAGRRPEHDQD